MTTSTSQPDQALERITQHLRAHIAELRRLEQAGAAPDELEERRKLIGRLTRHMTRLVKTALTPSQEPWPLNGLSG